jgi:hypothetical protein
MFFLLRLLVVFFSFKKKRTEVHDQFVRRHAMKRLIDRDDDDDAYEIPFKKVCSIDSYEKLDEREREAVAELPRCFSDGAIKYIVSHKVDTENMVKYWIRVIEERIKNPKWDISMYPESSEAYQMKVDKMRKAHYTYIARYIKEIKDTYTYLKRQIKLHQGKPMDLLIQGKSTTSDQVIASTHVYKYGLSGTWEILNPGASLVLNVVVAELNRKGWLAKIGCASDQPHPRPATLVCNFTEK